MCIEPPPTTSLQQIQTHTKRKTRSILAQHSVLHPEAKQRSQPSYQITKMSTPTPQDSTTQGPTVQNPTTNAPTPRQTLVEIVKKSSSKISGQIERAELLLDQEGDSYKRWKENLNSNPENKRSAFVTKAIEIKETTELKSYLRSLEKQRLTEDRGTWGGNN
ncbi:hypothetical protein HYFRA_00006558 [Hymenoscyphus fraxineus]|uniref:Uncharacterized protein n=1 Tax=Hymenoscyphus fraxineus TaxID=746836 RepID=A0A9N9KTK7_9HELO|nr:hypothetical protein HYFRA_00006558 [Hymenoscyphus fraxineus]